MVIFRIQDLLVNVNVGCKEKKKSKITPKFLAWSYHLLKNDKNI